MQSTTQHPNDISVLGVKVTPFDSYAHAVRCIAERIASGKQTFCVAVNPEKVYRAGLDQKLRAVLEQADIGICDGVGVAVAARILHRRKITRCTGVDLFLHLVDAAARREWKVYLLGASPESNQGAYRALSDKHPNLNIVGRQDGYFRDNRRVVEKINAAEPQLLFVAMGSPRQEFWIAEHRRHLNVPFCMGVGGAFDVLSGKAARAPAIFRRTGTEFLFRLVKEPKRFKRQVVLPLFMLNVLAGRLFANTKVQMKGDL